MKHLIPADVNAWLNIRAGEQRIGEVCHSFEPSVPLADHPGNFALLGIPEDIGARANHGRSGAANAWNACMSKLMNMQHHDQNPGNKLLILGTVACNDLMESAIGADVAYLRTLTAELDTRVEMIAEGVAAAGKTLIVAGGGHNNALPIIRGVAKGMVSAGKAAVALVNAVNLDPHADFRALEGRHSGNPFSYAMEEGFLNRYAAIGLHSAWNNQHMMNRLQSDERCFYNTFEDYISGARTFATMVWEGLSFVGQEWFGADLDMDSISGMPSSAFTPSGITAEHARYFAMQAGSHPNCCWFHLPEAAPTTEQEHLAVGKMLAYLITDFMRARTDLQRLQ
jgi:formiminoglutamase